MWDTRRCIVNTGPRMKLDAWLLHKKIIPVFIYLTRFALAQDELPKRDHFDEQKQCRVWRNIKDTGPLKILLVEVDERALKTDGYFQS